MSERIAVKLSEYYTIPERDRWINGDYCIRRKLIFDQHNRPLGHYSEIPHEGRGGYIWHSDYSGFLHISSEDLAIYWMNGGREIDHPKNQNSNKRSQLET